MTDAAARLTALIFLCVLGLSSAGVIGYQVITNHTPDAAVLGIVGTVTGFVIHNVGFTLGTTKNGNGGTTQ